MAFTLFAKVPIIPISGEIGPGLKTFLDRAVKDALKENPKSIIFEMDTFGGRVDAALEIVEIITSIPDSILTVAFVKTKAISAGALISLACNKLVMKSSTTIGDCAPIMMGQSGPKMMGEKFQSPLRAKFRSLAVKNNYPIKLAEAMVSVDKEIITLEFGDSIVTVSGIEYNDLTAKEKKKITKKRTIVPKGELLTISALEAKVLGFSSATVKNIEEIITALPEFKGITKDDLTRFEKNSSEDLLILLNKFAPILLMIGLGGLYMEIKTPGFGLFGIIGISAFALLFTSKYVVGLADNIEIALFLLGLVLLAVEIFVLPGFGIAGASGFLLILISVVLSFQSFVIPQMPWDKELFKYNIKVVGGIFVLSVPFFIVAFFSATKVLMTTRIGHQETEGKEDGFVAAIGLDELVGELGIVITTLRPSGVVEVSGKRVDSVTYGEFIEKGEAIKVVEVEGAKVTVIRSNS